MVYLWMPEANGVWQWSRGEEWMQASSLEQLIQDIKLDQAEDAVVFFPSRDAQIIQQNLSKAQYKQLGAEGIKYLLEEYVILPIDHMRVVSHFQMPDRLTVMGVAQNAITTITHVLTLLPVKVVALLPDFLILPLPKESEVVIANVNGRLLARHDAFAGASIDDLDLYLDVATQAQKYSYSSLTEEQSLSLFAVVDSDRREHMDYAFTASVKPKSHPLNILPKAQSDAKPIAGYWKACAVLVLALLLTQFSFDLIRWVKLKKVADQTASSAIDQYQSWFGQSARLNEQNLKSQFESNLRLNQQPNTQALQLLSRVGPILMQQQIVADKVNYETQVLSMNLLAKSADALQVLVTQLNQQGFKAELGNIQTQGAGVVGWVKIQ